MYNYIIDYHFYGDSVRISEELSAKNKIDAFNKLQLNLIKNNIPRHIMMDKIKLMSRFRTTKKRVTKYRALYLDGFSAVKLIDGPHCDETAIFYDYKELAHHVAYYHHRSGFILQKKIRNKWINVNENLQKKFNDELDREFFYYETR